MCYSEWEMEKLKCTVTVTIINILAGYTLFPHLFLCRAK